MDIMRQNDKESKTQQYCTDGSAGMKPDQAHSMLGGNKVISRSSFYAAINRGGALAALG